jgi:ribosomal protein S18 acetylase RimI-like enzyme
MIRKRVASVDDTVIYSLISQEIAPFSQQYKHLSSIPVSSIQKRLLRNTTFVCAKGNRSPLGFISVICKNRILFVDMLAVNARFQGRGLGKQLMLEAEQFGLKKGCKAVRLFVDDTNIRAIGFYQSMGYSTSRYITEISCYLMDKSLLSA